MPIPDLSEGLACEVLILMWLRKQKAPAAEAYGEAHSPRTLDSGHMPEN